ncbi:MAG: FAD-dependent oxidoreductase [Paracoccus sp. (in: a-proteobacteria)]|nr:FAD-dependent oxidoreductase [Paracoccus sp. (in: a-proteobacteria)]
MDGKDAATRKDDLRTGRPYWLSTPRVSVRRRADPAADRFDVIVVGAGISGALIAEALTREGRRVLILDRREPVRGSTPASTAMIQHEIDVPLSDLTRQRGARAANAVWRRSVRAVNDLVALSRDLRLNCQMQKKPALFLAGSEMDGEAMREEAALRRKIGIDAEWLDGARLRDEYGMDREAAILSLDSASANPAQLTAGLLRAAKSRGATIAAPVEITDMAELPGGIALATRDGRVLTCEHAVFCTGYEFLPQMRSPSHRVTSTWALATAKIPDMPDWLRRTIVWEAADPYLYFRAEPSSRLIAGGEDEKASDRNSDPGLLERKSKIIIGKLEKLLGLEIGSSQYRWAAPFSVTKDGLPIIDRVKGYERAWAVMGFGGNGITFSMIAAQIVAAGIAGRRDPDASYFRYR